MASNPFKQTRAEHSLHPLIAGRYSPVVFEPRAVERAKVLSCLEAARWAPSSFNDQPWHFIVAERDNQSAFAQALGCLVEANQAWAKQVGVLVFTVVDRTSARTGGPNRMAEHDLGLAVSQLTIQAHALGLAVHQMGGVDRDKIRATYKIPQGFDPMTGVAIGYEAALEQALTPQLAERDRGARLRKPMSAFVHAGEWGKSGA